MAAERRFQQPFAQGPLVSASHITVPRYDRFNFKEHMKNHMLKVSEASYMKRVMAVKATTPTEPEQEQESTKAQHTEEKEEEEPPKRNVRSSSTPGSTKAPTRATTPNRSIFKSSAEMKQLAMERRGRSKDKQDSGLIAPGSDGGRVKQMVAETEVKAKRSHEAAGMSSEDNHATRPSDRQTVRHRVDLMRGDRQSARQPRKQTNG